MSLWKYEKGAIVNSTATQRIRGSASSNSGWNLEQVKESDTAVLRYNRVAMLEAVLSIRDRQQQFVRRISVLILLLAGAFVIAAGILGWT